MTEEPTTPVETVPETAPEAPKATGKRGRKPKRFDLVPDSKGAYINGGLYAIYIIACLVVAVTSTEPNSLWFYLFYFAACFFTFQAVSVVGRHCMHMTPKSVVALEIVGKKLKFIRKNGEQVELTRDLDYSRRKNILVVQGSTHDNQKSSEVIRAGALPEGEFETLVDALRKFR